MAHEIAPKSDAIVMNERDHVATALRDLEAGETVSFSVGLENRTVKLLETVAFGHKLAVSDIGEGEDVCKYGEVIGRTTMEIAAGSHVHVHNIEGLRGRGDQAGKGANE
ncbi:UxaA family hydrolase [Cohnella herbarum]|uniref:UxaA family hydrolase n=1 Tax=Cohnella herbarum TaxID=2728023 RepID=A0A7Z2VFB7_9BACL|nr:UxaA family hydrolase [Cohnella herbarum]QJD82082.1 UxaA family hydrolase [Cohnella herbarum]